MADGDAGLLRARRRLLRAVSLFVWILGLSRVPVSVAYPLLSVGYVVNAIAAHYLFGEAVTLDALARHRLHRRRRLAGRAELTPLHPPMSALPYLKFAGPVLDEATIAGVGDVLRSGQHHQRAVGADASRPRCPQFCGGRPVRVLTSATAAVEVALQLCGIGPGDEVITCAQSFFTVLNMIVKVGATPVFVDCDLVTRNIDLAAVEAAITPRTRAIMPTHWPGSLRRHGRAARARARSAACA